MGRKKVHVIWVHLRIHVWGDLHEVSKSLSTKPPRPSKLWIVNIRQNTMYRPICQSSTHNKKNKNKMSEKEDIDFIFYAIHQLIITKAECFL